MNRLQVSLFDAPSLQVRNWLADIARVRESGTLAPRDAEKLAGRLSFAAQVCAVRLCVAFADFLFAR